MSSYREVAKELKSRGSNREDPSLDPVNGALEELGKPESDYSIILVGGTNGKGSTAEMISRCLQELGHDVGVYKSPHMISLRERIRVNHREIEEKEFERLYEEINSLDADLTFFEFMTVMAYRHFSTHSVDYAVMEVGMGGRLDATNVAESDISVITNIEEDHTQYLGETREEIAREKAEIAPWKSKLVTGDRMEPILEVAAERSTEVLDPLPVEKIGSKYLVEGQEFELPVRGSFQEENLETALRVVKELEELPDLQQAFSGLDFPGRMELVSRQPRLILDGAHNPAALRKVLEDFPEEFTCVFSALKSKAIGEMVEVLEERATKFYFTRPEFERAEDPEEIAGEASIEYEVEEDPGKALERALDEAGERGAVVVTGSLYLIGDIKKLQHQ